jgi:hypothetical protein
VIHNAGIGYREPDRVKTEDGVPEVFATNVLAPFVLTAIDRATGPTRLSQLRDAPSAIRIRTVYRHASCGLRMQLWRWVSLWIRIIVWIRRRASLYLKQFSEQTNAFQQKRCSRASLPRGGCRYSKVVGAFEIEKQ